MVGTYYHVWKYLIRGLTCDHRSTFIHEELRSWDPSEREAYQCAIERVADASDDFE